MSPILVTRPLLPDVDALCQGIRDIYDRRILTNNGPNHQELERRLKGVLGGREFILFNNGTIALMAALSALSLEPGSEVITTPFTFAATAHAITLLGLKPVFADIDPTYMTLSPEAVEKYITPRTSCILAVHVYGYPCDTTGLQRVATANNLALVYDAAHAFGTVVDGRHIGEFGDASAYSFHATKLFSTVEGGGVSFNRSDPAMRARDYRNFGIRSEDHVASVGLNGKMSELHALVGLLSLDAYQEEMAQRARIGEVYRAILANSDLVKCPIFPEHATSSHQYFPIRVPGRESVDAALKAQNVLARRYFHPLVTDYDCYRQDFQSSDYPNAVAAGAEALCLPYHSGVTLDDAERIARVVIESVENISNLSSKEL